MAKKKTRDFSDRIDEMIYTAQTFYAATEALHKAVFYENGEIDDMRMIPYLTNEAFAAELYLKVLHQMDYKKTPVNAHNLKRLFDGLPESTQTSILNHAMLSAYGYTQGDFMRALKTSSERFTEYRYFFELNGERRFSYYPLYVVIEGLKRTIEFRLGPFVDFIPPDLIQIRPIENESGVARDPDNLEDKERE